MRLSLQLSSLNSIALIGMSLGFLLNLSSCYNEYCEHIYYPFEYAPDIPIVVDSAKTMTFIITEDGVTDTVVLHQSIKDEYHTLEVMMCQGSFIQHKIIVWETVSGEVFNYILYSSLPSEYSCYFYSNYGSPQNVTKISFQNYTSIFAHDKIIAANDTAATKIESIYKGSGFSGFDEGILYFDNLGIREMEIPSKNFTMKRIR